jgi:hypothetical protein
MFLYSQVRPVREPTQIFLTSKFSYELFLQPHPSKTGKRTANRCEGITNNKPPGPIIMIRESKNKEHQSNHSYYTLL